MEPELPPTEANSRSAGAAILWGLIGLLFGLLFVIAFFFFYNSNAGQVLGVIRQAPESAPAGTNPARPTLTPTAANSGNDGQDSGSAAFLATPTATATPAAESGELYVLTPDKADIGWVSSGQEQGNNLGDSFLYSGILAGQVYAGAMQFDLSSIPRGAPIYSAALELTGLRDEDLSRNRDQPDDGVWAVRLLDSAIDQDWRRHNYQRIFNAPALQTLQPLLGSRDLAVEKVNRFELTSAQLEILKSRIIDDENPTVSFRIDGPLVGADNLFAWDSGYGPLSGGHSVQLKLNVGEPPATPPPYAYLVVTSSPTPENVVTAAAIVVQMTADATLYGTATPTPPNMVTATPYPEGLVIIPTPTPENMATAAFLNQVATAEALTTGTPLPPSDNAVTATPTPSATPTPTYIIITSTPTPESIFVAATSVVAGGGAIPTPLPENWVTPIVVTATPTPANAATAQAQAQYATAVAVTTGTATPTPMNMFTATPTPVFDVIPLIVSLPTPTPTPVPRPVPAPLLGKILFRSDREQPTGEPTGPGDEGSIYVYDPATGQLGRLTESWPYDLARQRDTFSADGRFRVFTKDTTRYRNVQRGQEEVGVREDVPAVYWYDSLYGVEEQVTQFGAGIAYRGVWSPAENRIAFISNDSGDDEIWAVNYDGSNLLQLTEENVEYNAREIGKDTFVPEVSRYPSWSPDGTQIVFSSNRTGNSQLWIMNADGTDERLLMGWDNWTPYNDWEPVWVKYQDPPPLLE